MQPEYAQIYGDFASGMVIENVATVIITGLKSASGLSKILQENRNRNGGVVKSDLSGQELVKPSKSQKGITPPQNEWQIDHIKPKDDGGSNSYSNAQVLSRKENRDKWNK